jgi:hypothetical protein
MTNEIKNTAKLVKEVLTESEDARNSDMILYVQVCQKLNPVALKMPFWLVLTALKEYNLPNIETVRRTRQKLQADNPELAGTECVKEFREKREKLFRKYARG